MSEITKVCEWRDPENGVVRVELWPEGHVLWVGGKIVSKSWEADPPAFNSVVTFDHEVFIGGVRYPPGQYAMKRVGPPDKDISF